METEYLVVQDRPDASANDIVLVQNLAIYRESEEIVGVNGTLEYLITVTDASDNKVEERFDLIVEDVNDLEPVFDPVPDQILIDEHPPNDTEVVTVKATDPDYSEVDVTYRMVSQNVPFAVDSVTGLVTVAQTEDLEIDYETGPSYAIIIGAYDGLCKKKN